MDLKFIFQNAVLLGLLIVAPLNLYILGSMHSFARDLEEQEPEVWKRLVGSQRGLFSSFSGELLKYLGERDFRELRNPEMIERAERLRLWQKWGTAAVGTFVVLMFTLAILGTLRAGRA